VNPYDSARRIIEHDERQAAEELRRERESNHAYERRCPGMKPTEQYQRGPIPASHPRWNSTADYNRYLARRERYKWRRDPKVK
jgi:hypothetical protein